MDKALAGEQAAATMSFENDVYVRSVLLHAEQVKVEVSCNVMHCYFVVSIVTLADTLWQL